jgi:hypothetical protein
VQWTLIQVHYNMYMMQLMDVCRHQIRWTAVSQATKLCSQYINHVGIPLHSIILAIINNVRNFQVVAALHVVEAQVLSRIIQLLHIIDMFWYLLSLQHFLRCQSKIQKCWNSMVWKRKHLSRKDAMIEVLSAPQLKIQRDRPSRQHCTVTLQILTVCFLAGGEGIREARTLFRSWLKDSLAKETAVQCPSS